jgi:glyoxylase-like metal-dependent hydrolase (beta-lactamase superfamily II)
MESEILRIHVLETGFFKLDGGAMFGIIPKNMWEKLNPPDENNLCTWAMRCLLVETADKKILIDTGIGDKQPDFFQKRFHLHGNPNIVAALQQKGFAPEDITDVFLTHLHFDHVGGAVSANTTLPPFGGTEGGHQTLRPTFPNATYWTNEKHWATAIRPNAREAASFLTENFMPLHEAGVLKMIPKQQNFEFCKGFRVRFTDGHTDALMMPILEYQNRTIVFCADSMPTSFHIGLPYVMAYDIRPLVSLKEKTKLVEDAARKKQILFFEHDPNMQAGTVVKKENGKIILEKAGNLFDFFN